MDAKQVYNVEVIKLLDGSDVTVKPLSIKKNRLAKKKLEPITSPDVLKDDKGKPILDDMDEEQPVILSEEEAEDVFLDVVALALDGQGDEYSDNEHLADVVDEQTMFEIIKVSTGFDFLGMQKRAQELMDRQMKKEGLL